MNTFILPLFIPKYTYRISVLIIWGVLLTLPSVAQTRLTSRSGESFVDDSYVRAYLEQVANESGAPGVSAAVSVRGKTVFSGGVGFADLDNKVPQNGKTVHNIGSVSKAFSVIAIMQLEEKGLVNLNDEIQKYLPYMPKKQKPITINHILTHTSGIRHYAKQDNDNYGFKRLRHYDNFEEATTIFRDDPLLFEPGAYYAYSSYSSNLMHGIIEKVSGMPFEDYMKKNVWQPAGMLSTCFDVPARIISNRGKGYVKDSNGTLINAPYEDVSYKYAGGGILSTPEDMLKLALALNRGFLLKQATLEKLYKPQFDKNKKDLHANPAQLKDPLWQGLIWWSGKDRQGHTWYGHSGTVKGTRSFLINFPAEQVIVAIQANIGSIKIDEYALELAQLFLAEEPLPNRP
ncbi:beta-lactamase family protein [Spirosoma taeanense]|uniref:Beta-lactamase family protein n=1 Tax=Spirosoma taeanense TaxID=2735870 RepID=A0A6M5Y8N7_9BACT|nr:serine hydrolase domain-containing protein [Spirosoma taeanense]QJW89620.1 beta-lactamase family protein [Spirosoma taeanense]